MIDVVTIGLLPLGLLDVDSEFGGLHCEKFYPSFCFFHIVIPNWDIIIWHIWNNEVRCWGYVTHGGWWYLVIQQIPHPDSLHSHSDIFFHTFSNHSGIWTLSHSSCPVTIPDPNSHPHTYSRGRHHHHSFHYLPSHWNCFSKPAHPQPHSPSWYFFALLLHFTHKLFRLSRFKVLLGCQYNVVEADILTPCKVTFGLCKSAAARSIYSTSILWLHNYKTKTTD